MRYIHYNNHVHVLTVLINEHYHCGFALMESQFFYCLDPQRWYGMSADLLTNATPQADNLW